MFTISQTAKQVKLSTKQLRDYEALGLICPSGRSASGYRLYSDDDIEKLSFVAHAREVGFSLPQIKLLLQLQANPHRKRCDVKALTALHIQELDDKINALSAMKNKLQTWHDACVGDDGSDCAILHALEVHDDCQHTQHHQTKVSHET